MSSSRSLVESGLSWLGCVPQDWRVTPLRYLVDFRSGGTPSKDREDFWNGDIPWASAKDLKSDVLFDTIDHLDEAAISVGGVQLVPENSVVVLVRGMMLAKTFPVVKLAVDMAINQDLKGLLPRPGVDAGFLAWALRGTTRETLNRLDEAGHGTKALRMEAWVSMQIAVPAETEQVAIAAFLDRETAKIDALVEAQRRLIELLKEKRQAVISHAVTKGLDPSAPMKDSGVEWLGQVPAHWEVLPLRALFRFVKRQTGDDLDVLSVYREYGVISKSSRDDNNNVTPEDLSKYQTVLPGDLVVNKMKAWQGSLGVSGLHGITSPDYAVFAPIHAGLSNYLHLLLRSQLLPDVYRLISNGIRLAQWRLEPEKFKELKVPFPPIAEQQAISEALVQSATQMDRLAMEAEAAITLLQERRAALISAAVTGKIDVRGLAQTAEAA